MWSDSSRVFHCFLLVFFHVAWTVHGFANNLVVTTIGCMTDLDTSEVIMNNQVKAPENSDFPEMHLAALVDGTLVKSPVSYSTEDLTVVFVNPYSSDEFNEDLQFVMQIEGEGAEFVSGGAIGCDGNKRVAARLLDNDGAVQLVVHDTTASFQITAGWATGQNAVRLTHPLKLLPMDGDTSQVNAAANKENEVVQSMDDAGDLKEETSEEVQQDDESLKQEKHTDPTELTNPPTPAPKPKAKTKPPKKEKKKRPDRPIMDEAERRKQLQAQMERNFPDKRDFSTRYAQGIEIATHQHVYACIFFVAAMGTVILLLQRKEKGRRDL